MPRPLATEHSSSSTSPLHPHLTIFSSCHTTIDTNRAPPLPPLPPTTSLGSYLPSQPGIRVDGGNLADTLRTGRAVIDHVRTKGPAILQVHTYRFQGHSPADPEHERGRKAEKKWARAECDPIKIFEASDLAASLGLSEATDRAKVEVKRAIDFAKASEPPPASLAKELEFPDAPDTDYNTKKAPENAEAITAATTDPEALATCKAHVADLAAKASDGTISIGDALNLAILEEMIRDPKTTCHAEDLQVRKHLPSHPPRSSLAPLSLLSSLLSWLMPA